MVVVGEVCCAAVDAAPVSFVDDAPLPGGRVALTSGGVDGSSLGVVDQGPDESVGGDAFDDAAGDRGAVVQCVAVAPDMEDDLVGGGVIGGEEPCERVRSLCRE